jgi:hypothetical protein
MTFTKKQTITLFFLIVAVMVLISVVVIQLTKTNDDIQTKESLVSEIQLEFEKNDESTQLQQEFDTIKDLNFVEKVEKFQNNTGSNTKNETDEPKDLFVEEDLDTEYRYLFDDLYVTTKNINELGNFNPKKVDLAEPFKINTWDDGTIVYKENDIIDVGDGRFVLQQKNLTLFNSFAYLQKDGVFFYLGFNIENIYQFQINGKKYWVTVIENNTGSNQLYFSGAFFAGMQKIKGVFYQDGSTYQNGNFLIMDKLVSGTEGVGRQKYRLDVKGVAESKVLDDYSKFVTVEK